MRVGIVPHTHWDREWYTPFQATRLRLVRLLDSLLPALEAEETHVHLDGQTALVDDYLEVRPGAEARIRRLVECGRLGIGPFAVPPDEFMVSGETLVRNLQRGLRRSAELGGATPVGYLPDMFGHVAQMPQILRQAGLAHAVVWRGVPAAVDRTAFWWEAPDGSRVRAEYLYGSYANGRDLPLDPDGLLARARSYRTELGDARSGGLLLMNGGDHRRPQTGLAAAVAAANAHQDEYRFVVTPLGNWLAAEPTEGLATWRGELRSAARAHLLPGVASTRVDAKRAAAAAERAVERRAEPLLALFRLPDEWAAAEALLDVAWRLLVSNSAHDSACACSTDEVVDAVVVRYGEARQVGDALAAEALKALAGDVAAAAGSLMVVNTTAHQRAGLVEVELPAAAGSRYFVTPDGAPRGVQVLGVVVREVFSARVAGTKVLWVLDMMQGSRFGHWPIQSVACDTASLTLTVAAAGEETVNLGPAHAHLAALGATGEPVAVRVVEGPRQRMLLDTGPIAGFGWTTLSPVHGDPPSGSPVTAVVSPHGSHCLDNGLVRAEVDPADGTVHLVTADGLTVAGLNRYVDGGDGGDTYNWSAPDRDRSIWAPESVAVEIAEAGPLRARLRVTAAYCWPTHALGDSRSCTARASTVVDARVRTTFELRVGDPVLRIEVEIDNRARDHRLRAHFPLPVPVEQSAAECAFAVVQRGLTAEGGPGEAGVATFPARRFVDCSDGNAGLALFADSLLEYEVLGGGTEVALTLLRAVGWLSRSEPALRPSPAGPAVATEGAQLQGRVVRRYGVLLHRGDWREAALHRRADDLFVPLEVAVPGSSAGRLPPDGQALVVEGAEVSAVLRHDGDLVVRVFNPAPEPAAVRVAWPGGQPASGTVVDLAGAVVGPWAEQVELGGGQIATLRMDSGSSRGGQ